MNPYVNHNRVAAYVTTEADVGQRWITMLGYCSSTYAGASDYLLNETMEIALSVINGGVAPLLRLHLHPSYRRLPLCAPSPLLSRVTPSTPISSVRVPSVPQPTPSPLAL
jgi:hypothetical protein